MSVSPVLIALLLNTSGLLVFANGPDHHASQVACLIFTVGLAALLSSDCLFPCSYLESPWLLQFLFAVYILEFVQHSFWYPLEKSIFLTAARWGEDCEDCCYDDVSSFIKWCQLLPTLLTFTLCSLFSLSFLHMSKFIDISMCCIVWPCELPRFECRTCATDLRSMPSCGVPKPNRSCDRNRRCSDKCMD